MSVRLSDDFFLCEMFSTAEMKLNKVRACEVSVHLGTRRQWRATGPVVQRCLVLFLDPDDPQLEQTIIKDAQRSSALDKLTMGRAFHMFAGCTFRKTGLAHFDFGAANAHLFGAPFKFRLMLVGGK